MLTMRYYLMVLAVGLLLLSSCWDSGSFGNVWPGDQYDYYDYPEEYYPDDYESWDTNYVVPETTYPEYYSDYSNPYPDYPPSYNPPYYSQNYPQYGYPPYPVPPLPTEPQPADSTGINPLLWCEAMNLGRQTAPQQTAAAPAVQPSSGQATAGQTSAPQQPVVPVASSQQTAQPNAAQLSNPADVSRYVKSNPLSIEQMKQQFGVAIQGSFSDKERESLQYALMVMGKHFDGKVGNGVQQILYVPASSWSSTYASLSGQYPSSQEEAAMGLTVSQTGLPKQGKAIVMIKQGAFNTPQIILHELGHAVGRYWNGALSSEDEADGYRFGYCTLDVCGTMIQRDQYV